MAARFFTRGIGLFYLILGICAFIPMLNGAQTPEDPAHSRVYLHFETLFNQFPMNYMLGVIFAAVGLAGIWASLETHRARVFDRALFVASLVALVIGLCPLPISTVFGLVPLYSWTGAIFLATAMFTFYAAFFDGPMPASATEPVFKHVIKH